MQQLSGQYIGVSAPYGYLKDSKDNHKLIIDKYASEIIKRIFKMTLELKSRINKEIKQLTKELAESNISVIYVYDNDKVEIDYKS